MAQKMHDMHKLVELVMEGKTQSEIASQIGISRQRVSQIFKENNIRYADIVQDREAKIGAKIESRAKSGLSASEIACELEMTYFQIRERAAKAKIKCKIKHHRMVDEVPFWDRVPLAAEFIISPEAQNLRDRWTKLDQTLWEIWLVLQDNKWHSSQEIAVAVKKSHSYIKDIMRSCKVPWGLASSLSSKPGEGGYCLLKKGQPIIV